jgi:hypothetical protein
MGCQLSIRANTPPLTPPHEGEGDFQVLHPPKFRAKSLFSYKTHPKKSDRIFRAYTRPIVSVGGQLANVQSDTRDEVISVIL